MFDPVTIATWIITQKLGLQHHFIKFTDSGNQEFEQWVCRADGLSALGHVGASAGKTWTAGDWNCKSEVPVSGLPRWLGLPHKMVTSKWVSQISYSMARSSRCKSCRKWGSSCISFIASLHLHCHLWVEAATSPSRFGFLFFNMYLFGCAGS